MKIKKTSIFTGNIRSMDINITKVELEDWFSGQRVINPVAYDRLSKEEIDFITAGTSASDIDQYLEQINRAEILEEDEEC